MRYFLLLIALPLVLLGCATLSEDQCRAGDWREIGFSDGTNGRTADYVAKHAKACADYGIDPDVTAWEAGRQKGLPLYCTPRRAYEEGSKGRELSPVCPAAVAGDLRDDNRRGLIWHRIGQDIAEASREIDRINAELASLPGDDPSRAALISERSALRLEILTLRAERGLYRF
jgi:Protein of unknown function (DUF2799)